MIDQAVEVYFRLAYGGEPRKLPGEGDDVLAGFTNECAEDGGCERWTLRLGNRNYPFMKLVLQEHIVPGQYYFCVDTHDQMEIRPDFPDYEAWMQVKRFNLDLKKSIEEAMAQAGLPTIATLKQCSVLAPQRNQPGTPLIFVVDDEECEAQALEQVLRRNGYDVAIAADGREALDRLPFLKPALMILDYEMPEVDGLMVIQELRRLDLMCDMPILLTTASRVLGSETAKADGFLQKPYRSNDLLALVDSLLASR